MNIVAARPGTLKRIWTVARFGLLAVLITALVGGLWTGLLIANLSTGPAMPWAVLVMAALLWLVWHYLDGKGWPGGTADVRHRLLRAAPVAPGLFGWSVIAGVCSIAGLIGFWIVLFRLVKAPGNSLPDFSGYPLLSVALVLVMAGLVGGVTEEAAFRGYFQSVLEREFNGPAAIIVVAIVMAPVHGLTQGFVWTTLLFYFCVDVIFGMLAYLTKSILPGVVVHSIGLFAFFAFVWPYDSTRQLISVGGPDTDFWLSAGQALVFGLLALVAFRRLAALADREKTGAVH